MRELRIPNGEGKRVWFFSDPHFYHKNLCRGTSRWPDKLIREGKLTEAQNMLEYELRPFNNEIEMTDHLIDSINSRVGEDDILFCLGDWCFGGTGKIYAARQRIKCNTLHLILGNHDKEIRENRGSIQTIFDSVNDYLEIWVEGQHIVLSHYSMRVWNKSHRGTFHLYGHSHGHLPQHMDKNGNPFKTMDVGMDAVYKEFGEYKPLSFYEIKDIMKDRVSTKIDHHK